LAYLLAYPDAAAGGVLLAGGSHPWKGGVAWYNDLAGVPLFGPIFVRTVTYPAGHLAMESAIENVFDPNPVPPDYKQHNGIGLSLRPTAFSANAEDVRLLSDYLAVQSKRYSEIQHPLLLITGSNDDIVPSRNHADRLEKQIDGIERIDLENTGHALHHVRPGQIATAIDGFVSRVADEVDRPENAASFSAPHKN
jgi:pimeloyl-ACP methyl ester carboxylesterase